MFDQNVSSEIAEQSLTAEAINQLKKLQENENEELEMNLNTLANSVCYLASLIQRYQLNDLDTKKVIIIISDLALVREELLKLRKE
jgi:predicted RNase H-like nuclease